MDIPNESIQECGVTYRMCCCKRQHKTYVSFDWIRTFVSHSNTENDVNACDITAV